MVAATTMPAAICPTDAKPENEIPMRDVAARLTFAVLREAS